MTRRVDALWLLARCQIPGIRVVVTVDMHTPNGYDDESFASWLSHAPDATLRALEGDSVEIPDVLELERLERWKISGGKRRNRARRRTSARRAR